MGISTIQSYQGSKIFEAIGIDQDVIVMLHRCRSQQRRDRNVIFIYTTVCQNQNVCALFLLEEKAENCKMLKIKNPILTDTDLLKIKTLNKDGFKVEEIPITYYKNTSLKKDLKKIRICKDWIFDLEHFAVFCLFL